MINFIIKPFRFEIDHHRDFIYAEINTLQTTCEHELPTFKQRATYFTAIKMHLLDYLEFATKKLQ